MKDTIEKRMELRAPVARVWEALRERYEQAFRMNTSGWEQQLESIRAYVGKTAK